MGLENRGGSQGWRGGAGEFAHDYMGHRARPSRRKMAGIGCFLPTISGTTDTNSPCSPAELRRYYWASKHSIFSSTRRHQRGSRPGIGGLVANKGAPQFMSRYTGPKARINRRLSTQIYESAGAVRASSRRESPPGMHPRGRKTGNYGAALSEKQKIKYYYGLGERQLRRYYELASASKGNTALNLLTTCERRLDNVVRRAGFTKTRPQARQGIVHGHFRVNGVKVTKPSYLLRAGDVIKLRGRDNLKNLYRGVIANNSVQPLDWIEFDTENLTATVRSLPTSNDISLPVDANIVVEFLSR